MHSRWHLYCAVSRCRPRPSSWSTTRSCASSPPAGKPDQQGGETQLLTVLAEERHHMILETIGDRTRVCAVINLKIIGNAVAVENGMQLTCIRPQIVGIPYIHCNRSILPEIADVLIDKRQRRIGSPFRNHIRLGNTILARQ